MNRRCISMAGRRTSIKLEPAFWTYLDEAAAYREITWSRLVEIILDGMARDNRSSVLREWCLWDARVARENDELEGATDV